LSPPSGKSPRNAKTFGGSCVNRRGESESTLPLLGDCSSSTISPKNSFSPRQATPHSTHHGRLALAIPPARLIRKSRTSRYGSTELAERLERFMKRVPIVHRQLARMIKLVAINDDFRLEFCSDSRPGMKGWSVVHGAIICCSDVRRHLVGIRVLPPVESDVCLRPRAHDRD
jgi:hypothetical protein